MGRGNSYAPRFARRPGARVSKLFAWIGWLIGGEVGGSGGLELGAIHEVRRTPPIGGWEEDTRVGGGKGRGGHNTKKRLTGRKVCNKLRGVQINLDIMPSIYYVD